MYNHTGFRSAWYSLQKGDCLNGPGETNPFPQAFEFLAGSGEVKLGEKTLPVNGGEEYSIQPGTEHIVWNQQEEPLMLIFLAWGEATEPS